MLTTKQKIKLLNWWPPLIGTGIKLLAIDNDFKRFEVRMKLRWYNKNLIGIHFGGSLYTMCDPWYMFILSINLGKDYQAIDKAANIRYKKPGRGTVTCVFELTNQVIEEIRYEIDQVGKKDYSFLCEIKNEAGETVAEVDKIVSVRKKNYFNK